MSKVADLIKEIEEAKKKLNQKDQELSGLIKAGEYCKIRGHSWEEDFPSFFFTNINNHNRVCISCGKVQHLVWEDRDV